MQNVTEIHAESCCNLSHDAGVDNATMIDLQIASRETQCDSVGLIEPKVHATCECHSHSHSHVPPARVPLDQLN